MWVGTVLVAVYTSSLLLLAAHARVSFGDSAYFLERLRDMADFHLRPYRDLEFAYGPLLLYPALWLHWLAYLPMAAAYAITLAIGNAAGLLCCFYLLNQLPLSQSWRYLWFALAVLAQLNPFLGLNYSFCKFALPFAVAWWATHQRTPLRVAGGFMGGTLLVLALSPELAIGFAAGTLTYGVLRSLPLTAESRVWLPTLLSPLAAYAIFLALVGPGSLQRLGQAAQGALNLIIEPLPTVFILLVALAWLAPRAVGSALQLRHPDAPGMALLLVMALGLLPGALGRADTLHIFFNGFGLLLLATLAVGDLRHGIGRVWAGCVSFLTLYMLIGNLAAYSSGFAELVIGLRHPASGAIDVNRLRSDVGTDRVATPFLPDLATELQLRETNLYQPDFYPGIGEIWDASGEQRKITSLRRSAFALVPTDLAPIIEPLPNRPSHLLFRFGYAYRQRRQPYLLGASLLAELHAHWQEIDRFGDWKLMRRKN